MVNKIIHITSDEKFINQSYDRFEEYYPRKNYFFIQKRRGVQSGTKYVTLSERKRVFDFFKRDQVNQIIGLAEPGDVCIVHLLNQARAALGLKLKEKGCTIFWVFYGAELYDILAERNVLQIYDDETRKRKRNLKESFIELAYRFHLGRDYIDAQVEFIRRMDGFMFWNRYDYELLRSHFETKAPFIYFRYYQGNFSKLDEQPFINRPGHIVLSHSASKYGNHLFGLKKIVELEESNSAVVIQKIIAPLSYGSLVVRNEVIDYLKTHFQGRSEVLVDYMPKEDYFERLRSSSVAIFPSKRQLGANNIYFLLGSGVKVFLRDENNLLAQLQEDGFYVYSMYKDLNTIRDLEPLSLNQKEENRTIVLDIFSKESIDRTYSQLFDRFE